MKTIAFIFLLYNIYTIGLAQSASILISPDTGISANKTSYQQNHKIVVQTQSENHGFVQKTDPIEVGTFISEANGGYASYGTLGFTNLSFTTNTQGPQVTLNIVNFMGIGGQPFNAMHVYGNAQITGAGSINTASNFLKTDNNGKLTCERQTSYYSIPRSAFSPIIASNNNTIAESDEGGIYFTLSQSASDYLEAPIQLPMGATITGIEFYFIDNSSSNLTLNIVNTTLGSSTNVDFSPFLTSSDAQSGIRSLISNNVNNGTGIPIYDGATYNVRVFAYDSSTAWDGAKTQVVAVKIIYSY